MTDLNLATIIAWLLAAVFLAGSVINATPPEKIRKDYARWGYPDWFHYITAVLEFAAAVMLVVGETRPLGALLGLAIMAAAAGTTLLHREYAHSIAPLIMLILTAAVGWKTM